MKIFKKNLMGRMVLLVVFCGLFNSLFACNCGDFPPFGISTILRSDYFFKGIVVEKTHMVFDEDWNCEEGGEEDSMYKRYAFRILEHIRGFEGDSMVYIFAFISDSACGTEFDMGWQGYVFADEEEVEYFKCYKEQTTYYTTICHENFGDGGKGYQRHISIIDEFKHSKGKRTWMNVKNQIDATGELVEGVPNGMWTFYHVKSGFISGRRRFEMGARTGDWVFYDKRGDLESKGRFSEGEKDGAWAYFEDGLPSYKGKYKHGKKDGRWIYYKMKPNGKFRIKEVIWKNGSLESERILQH